MGKFCSAFHCNNSNKVRGISFYRFPKCLQRRRLWESAVNRQDPVSGRIWQSTEHSRLCSRHFISGAKSDDPLSPDYVPKVFKHIRSPRKRQLERLMTSYRRRTESSLPFSDHTYHSTERQSSHAHAASVGPGVPVTEAVPVESAAVTLNADDHTYSKCDKPRSSNEKDTACSAATQTDCTVSDLDKLQAENHSLRQLNEKLQLHLDAKLLSLQHLQGNDDLVKSLTGLPSSKMLLVLFEHVKPYIQNRPKVPQFQQLLLCLLKMRLNVNFDFLAYIVGVDKSTVCRIFAAVIAVLDKELYPHLVFWPDRRELYKSMPLIFRTGKYRHTVVIIDCFEVFIERPSDLMARAQTYSQYKSHNTAKYLIGVAPQGAITFISKGWGGRTSDKYLTEHCGLLDMLVPGDQVLADRGFRVADSIALRGCSLHIPDFTKGVKQLPATSVEGTRQLASVRIHVERVIGVVRQKYSILQSTIPITFLKCDETTGLTTLDKIVRVACALTNMNKTVVPKN